MTPIPYEVVDVFTTAAFGGNPLAVIPDARGLDERLMQLIAAEFGFSETVFVFPPIEPVHTAHVRIFTPTAEVPFAGHPNVGTAFVLARRASIFGQPVGDALWFEERAGLVAVTVQYRAGAVSGAAITAPQALEVGQEVAVDMVAACASLAATDITVERHRPLVLSVGLPFVFTEVASRAALARARPNRDRFVEAEAAVPLPDGGFSLFLYVPEPAPRGRYSARMFAPLDNVLEDPATGSASAALAAYLVQRMPAADLEAELLFDQGVDMGRPSRLNLSVRKVLGMVRQVVVGGECMPIMRGELLLGTERNFTYGQRPPIQNRILRGRLRPTRQRDHRVPARDVAIPFGRGAVDYPRNFGAHRR